MKSTVLAIVLLVFSHNAFAQTNYLATGNKYLASEKYTAAEQIFREAIKTDSSNIIYKSQLALSLLQQSKHEEAKQIIDKILLKEPTNIGALWYGGVNSFSNKKADFRESISYFEKVLPLLEENQGQFYAANWFIGRSYRNLLQTTGINYEEVSRMLKCYSVYIRLQPNAEDRIEIVAFVKHIQEIRPPENVKKWINKI
jgi:tetratricopeptide (TPR) repeat protein